MLIAYQVAGRGRGEESKEHPRRIAEGRSRGRGQGSGKGTLA